MGLTIYQKLAEIQRRIKHIQKTGKTTSGPLFTYASSSDVLEPIREAMVEVGLFLSSNIKSMEVREIPKKDKLGNDSRMFFTLLHMEYTWINVENPSETLLCEWAGQGTDDFEKGIGKALTYTQKYFLIQTFLLPRDDADPDGDTHKDDDYPYNGYKPPAKPPAKPPTYNNGNYAGNGNQTSKPPPATNGNGNHTPKPQPPPQQPTNGNGTPQPTTAKLRNDCVEFLKIFALGQDLEKELFAYIKPEATMLSQISDAQIPTLHSLLNYASVSTDYVKVIRDEIEKQNLYDEIRESKRLLVNSGKFSQEEVDSFITKQTQGKPYYTLSIEIVKNIFDDLNKRLSKLDSL